MAGTTFKNPKLSIIKLKLHLSANTNKLGRNTGTSIACVEHVAIQRCKHCKPQIELCFSVLKQ